MQVRLSKFIAVMLVVIILGSISWPVVSYSAELFLSENELESQNTTSKDCSVNFDVQYENGKHGAIIDQNKNDEKINIALSLKKDGYIKEATIDLSNTNFEISQVNKSDKVQNFDAENKKITFGQMTSKEKIAEQIIITPINKEEVSEDNFNKDNHIKLTCTFVNTNLKEIKVEQEIVIHTEWIAKNIEANLNYEVTKYIPYVTENESNLIVQGKITSNVKDDVLPVKNTKININTPQIAGEYPEKVTVINSTEETTEEINKNGVTYDENTGKLTIEDKNEVENGKIKWQKNKPQAYIVTYIYSAKVYENIKDKSIKLNYQLDSELALYSNKDITVKAKATVEKEQKEKLGEIAEVIIENPTNEDIYKGYMYNNKVTAEENKRETDIANRYTLNIAYSNLIDSFTISQNDDKFTTSKEQEYKANTYNKELKISKQEFDNVLGADGKIEIQSKDGTLLSTIDKDTKAEQNEIKIDLASFRTENIVLETSKPQTEGSLNFEITKAIEKDNDYSIEEIKEFTNLKSSLNVVAKNSDINIVNQSIDNITQLKEPTQKVNITTNNDRLSTVEKNDNIELKITLENDGADDLMYTNPKIKVNLPQGIEEINIKSARIFFDEELKLENISVHTNEDGTKVIETALHGSQTRYNNPSAQGATVVITTDITLNKLTPTTNAQIDVFTENDDENKTEASNNTNLKLIAPTGLVTTNGMKGYNGDEKLEVINGEPKEALISAKSSEKELTFEMNVINNYENSLEEVVVLGRTMFKDNKDIATMLNMGTTIDIPLSSKITITGIPEENVQIYYSTNGDATTDLTNANNLWKKEITDYATIKSYMIVLKDYSMEMGDTFKFTYTATVPANLDYNNTAYETYGVYFKNNKETVIIDDKAFATKIGINTGKMATLEAKIIPKLDDGKEIKAGESLDYTISIKNFGTIDAEDATININIPENVEFIPQEGDSYRIKTIMPRQKFEILEEPELKEEDIDNNPDLTEEQKQEQKENLRQYREAMEEQKKQIEEYEKMIKEMEAEGIEFDENITETKNVLIIDIGKIKANSEFAKKITFSTLSSELIINDGKVEIEATIKFNKNESVKSNKVTNYIKRVHFTTFVDCLNDEDIYEVGKTFQYIVAISLNDYYKTVKNGKLELTIPDELEINDITDKSGNKLSKENISQKNNIVSINLGDINSNEPIQLNIKFLIKNFDGEKYKKEITVSGNVMAADVEKEKISDISIEINKPGIKITQSCNIPEKAEITAAENFKYIFTIVNQSAITLESNMFSDKLPEEVQFKRLEIIYSDGTTDSDVQVNDNGTIQKSFTLKGEEQVIINIEVVAKSLSKDTVISNKATIEQEKIGKLETNIITHLIKMFDKNNIKPNPGEDDTKTTKKIIGTVWIDSNKNGIKDDYEPKVQNVPVLLLDENGNIVTNSKNEVCVVWSGNDGTYIFSDIYKGNYTIVFLYESSKYSATIYRKDGIDESKNSDAIDKTVVYEGKSRIAGVTENILVKEENIYNIDFGLIEKAKFDLKLDKIVKKITTNNGKRVEEHQYENNFAKIDFESKYVNQSSMIIEYEIKVTNEGAIEGYAKKIVDYIPKEFKFSSELNKDWYEGGDGAIYNVSLANEIIKPGETKKLTVVLTKNINSEGFGMFSNTAEIYEASNNYGMTDIDSTPGNRVLEEDDYSNANVLVGIKTGEVAIYTTLTICIIAIIGTGVYVIRKKVLR